MSNRVQTWLEDFPGFASAEFAPTDTAEGSESSLPHVLYSPLHYEPKYAYPLLIWLHGQGKDERQLLDIMPLLSLRNYVAIAPKGLPGGGTNSEDLGWPVDPAAALQTETLVFGCLQRAQQCRQIATKRVFLGGVGEGGTMAIRVALANPRSFEGVISLEGPLPKGHNPLSQVADARNLALWLAHGRDSRAYPIDEACADLRLLHTAGMQITMRQYPSSDACLPLMLADLNSWLMELVCGTGK